VKGNKKRFAALFMSLVLMLSLCLSACGSSSDSDTQTDTDIQQEASADASVDTPADTSGDESTDGLLTEEVVTDKGTVKGFTSEGTTGKTIYNYYGIPYAEAPVGDLRWHDAQEKEAWDGVLDCTTPLTEQKSSYQFGTDLLAYFETLNVSEDCLYLNVISPAETVDENLPVIVWFHGGGMFGGSGSEEVYNLTNLPEHGCVFVSVTMRLGIFGMIATDSQDDLYGSADAGNYIMSDMIASLNWVKNNIEAFGGDASNVTIMGESGGGYKVSALMASDKAAGLFNRAIMQSGIDEADDWETAKADGNALLEALGVSSLDEARSISADEILEAYNNLGLSTNMLVDGYYLMESPNTAIASGNYNKVNVIIGANEGELANLAPMMNLIPNAVAVMNQIEADGNQAYAYILDQVPSNWREIGAHCVHSMDLAYLFGDYEDSVRYFSGGPWVQNCAFWLDTDQYPAEDYIKPVMDDDDLAFADEMMSMWVSFATDGDPNIEGSDWQAWTQADENYIYLTNMNGETSSMKTGFGDLAQ
jgi:para-nitrobenzyl esterase